MESYNDYANFNGFITLALYYLLVCINVPPHSALIINPGLEVIQFSLTDFFSVSYIQHILVHLCMYAVFLKYSIYAEIYIL